MFEVGFTEILLICGLALIVLGPEKLPRLAAQIGRWVGRARGMARQFREQLDREVELAEFDLESKKRAEEQKKASAAPVADDEAANTTHRPYSGPEFSDPVMPSEAPQASTGDTPSSVPAHLHTADTTSPASPETSVGNASLDPASSHTRPRDVSSSEMQSPDSSGDGAAPPSPGHKPHP